ncbi:MAG: dephospho-CoA kinase [Gammaproteobacteria bacterium]|nr:dephospho-CoA kinase [Gammaproteobacteria bacterium]
MLIIGLTGGIGSGKSTVAHYFEALGVPVIDADIIARELVAPGQPALGEIAHQLGPELVLADGNLDRAQLRQRVFAHNEERKRLEAILHPKIRECLRQRVNALRERNTPPAYCILSIPLLIESGWIDLVQRVLVVDASPAQQQQRASQRDGLSPEHVSSIIRNQADRDTRLAAADDIIHNDADLPALQAQVETLHRRYLQLAHAA